LKDRLDLIVVQRPVVLELLNADRLVDVPQRHLPRVDARDDRFRPGTRLFIGHERHRAMLFGRWHDSHFCWKIGATSLVNVTDLPASAAAAGIAAAPNTSALGPFLAQPRKKIE